MTTRTYTYVQWEKKIILLCKEERKRAYLIFKHNMEHNGTSLCEKIIVESKKYCWGKKQKANNCKGNNCFYNWLSDCVCLCQNGSFINWLFIYIISRKSPIFHPIIKLNTYYKNGKRFCVLTAILFHIYFCNS